MKKSVKFCFLGEGSVTFFKHFVVNRLTQLVDGTSSARYLKQNNHESLFKDFFEDEMGIHCSCIGS